MIMSEKNDKKQRKQEKNDDQPPSAKKKELVGTMEVDVFSDGTVQVRNFPESHPAQSIQIMAAGMIELAMYFIGKAAMQAQSESRIVKPGDPGFNVFDFLNKQDSKRHGI